MSAAKILWVDDEIDLLKPHILFLQGKGYDVVTSNNGYDAIDLASSQPFDLIILDEMMPGLTGLETLPRIKELRPMTPVIMVTKSEEENIMDKAVGSKIADYLIKPVNPNQVLLSIKKNVHSQQLVTEQTTADYRSEFGLIASSFASARTFADWVQIYKKLVGWEVELTESTDPGVREILSYQKNEANNEFAKFVRANYLSWFSDRDADAPVLSHQLVRSKVFPIVDASAKTTLFLIDNFRLDQWRMIRPVLHGLFDVEQEDFYCSILPTATQYARNAIFAGLTPLAIDKIMPDLWLNDNEHGGKNQHEEDFLRRQMQSQGKSYKLFFDKIVKTDSGKRLIENFDRVAAADFSVIVYNFLDILSHARTETQIIRDLAEDEAAFRSLTRSWFEHSDLLELMRLGTRSSSRRTTARFRWTVRSACRATARRRPTCAIRPAATWASTPRRCSRSRNPSRLTCPSRTSRPPIFSPTTATFSSIRTIRTVSCAIITIRSSTAASRWRR